ncbi:MAG: sialidase, partial [Pyrinomonadaceae bacterium]
MTKDKQVYTTQLQVVTDPRSNHTPEGRRAQLDLSLKLYDQLGNMTFNVERINEVRLALNDRASKLPANDPLVKRLEIASAAVDELRKKIVATKEGGAITGEERLR